MFSIRTSTISFAIAFAGLATAQSLSGLGLSQSCSNALTAAVNNPQLSPCLNILGAISAVETVNGTSVVPGVNSWLLGLCAANPCETSVLQSAANNITTGCATDLAQTGASSGLISTIFSDIVSLYPTVRDIACLKNTTGSTNELCVNELLTGVQTALGEPLTLTNIENIPNMVLSGSVGPNTIPKSLLCGSCLEAAWSLIKTDIPAIANNATVTNALTSECGASFVSATTLPQNIAEGTGTAVPSSSSSSAAGSTKVAISARGLVGVTLGSLVALGAGGAMLL